MRLATLTRILRQANLADLDLEVGQDLFLDQLSASEGRSMSAVATVLNIRPSTISKMAARLETDGLCVRYPDQDDRRLTLVRLTDLGAKYQSRVRQTFVNVENDIVRHLVGGPTPVMLEELQRLDTALSRQVGKLR